MIVLFFAIKSYAQESEVFTVKQAEENLDFAISQYQNMHRSIIDLSTYPRCVKSNGWTRYVKPKDWTSGFYPGSLWYLYEYSGDSNLERMAEESNINLSNIKSHTKTHDLGFILYCSFGNGYRLTNKRAYRNILIQGAYSLSKRFDPKTGCIRSWDWKGSYNWQYPVIIDNMMNLELLFWAAKATGDQSLFDIATKHADTTMKNHYRSDYSCYHVVDYNKKTGKARWKGTRQGHAHESSWARGQAWGLYGFTMTYRETHNVKYLKHANKIANYILTHPNLHKDFIPYWDFNAPEIPSAKRDASAAAIMASALIELGTFANPDLKNRYIKAAEKILYQLSTSAYRVSNTKNNHFILKHSVGHKPKKSEIDTSIIYADYYFIEALMRYIDLKKIAGRQTEQH